MTKSLKEWITRVTNNVPRQKFGTSASSFGAAMPSNATANSYYIAIALNNLATNIANYSTGIHQVQSGGPAYGIVLYKLSASYYCGLVLSYQRDTALVYFKRDQLGYHIHVAEPSLVGGYRIRYYRQSSAKGVA